jgi:cell division protein FtsA
MGKLDNSCRVAGLDVGSTKIAAVIGEIKEECFEITGVGSYPSSGVHNGIVIDIESTAKSIRKAVDQAEQMAGYEIPPVYVGISGSHLKSSNRDVNVALRHNEVTQSDISRVIEIVMAETTPPNREFIHVLPLGFTIDDKYSGIQNPLGMSGVRLNAEVYLVTGEATYINHVVRSCRDAGVDVAGIAVASLASSAAVLTPEEKEQGAVLLDIGGEISELVILHRGAVIYSSVLECGGNRLTRALVNTLLIPINDAEQLKIKYRGAIPAKSSQDQNVKVPGLGGRQKVLSRETLLKILESETIGVLNQLNDQLNNSLCKNILTSGCILTGGTALLPDIDELAEQTLNLPVRVGHPRYLGGLASDVESPVFSTAVGLAKFGSGDRSDAKSLERGNILKQVTTFVKDWLHDLKIVSKSGSH